MSLARFADPLSIITTSLEVGRRGTLTTEQQSPDTLQHVATLLRQGVIRGIVPQWVLRRPPGVEFSSDELVQIADLVEEGFVSGRFGEADEHVVVKEDDMSLRVSTFARDWRIDFYA